MIEPDGSILAARGFPSVDSNLSVKVYHSRGDFSIPRNQNHRPHMRAAGGFFSDTALSSVSRKQIPRPVNRDN
jgi:hypothetical protein